MARYRVIKKWRNQIAKEDDRSNEVRSTTHVGRATRPWTTLIRISFAIDLGFMPRTVRQAHSLHNRRFS